MKKIFKSLPALLATTLLFGCIAAPPSVIPPAPDAITEVRDVVLDFGSRLQLVSLLAPDAGDQVRQQYAGLVAPALLEQWADDPLSAPGRLTSSPWPDRIEVTQITFVDGRYIVEGGVVEATSTGDSGSYPVLIVLEDFDGSWLIADYQAGDRP